MVLNKGIWDPKPRVTISEGTNLKSLKAEALVTIMGVERKMDSDMETV